MTDVVVTAEQKATVNASLAAFLDKQLSKEVSLVLGPKTDVAKVALLTATLKNNLRSKLGLSLGVAGGGTTGSLGGSAGGGIDLEVGAGGGAGYAGGASGKVGGVPTGNLSLGSGLGTRASRPNSSDGSINFGVSGGAGFGIGAQAGLQDVSAPLSPSASISIQKAVLASLNASMAGAGLSAQAQASLLSDLQPAINTATQDSVNSAFGPGIGGFVSLGASLLETTITMNTHGNWKAYVTVDYLGDNAPEPTGPFIIDMDGVEFRGTVEPDRSGAFGGRRKVKVVGGAGGLDVMLPQVRNYSGGLTKVKTIVDDILRDSGETLSSEADPTILGQRLEGWQRVQSKASEALDILCNKLGCEWRVLRDGAIWIGVDTWPDVEPSGTILDSDWADGVVVVAPDYATLVPGIRVLGQNVNKVVHKLTGSEYRAELYTQSVVGLLQKVTDRFTRGNEYLKRYRCAVTRQNADKTVDVMIDDPRMKGRGVAKCSVRASQPNTVINVKKGARCLVGWSDGDPSLPYVSDWESTDFLTSIEIGSGGRGAAYSGGAVKILLPPLMPFQGTSPLGPIAGVLTIIEPGAAVIEGGFDGLLI